MLVGRASQWSPGMAGVCSASGPQRLPSTCADNAYRGYSRNRAAWDGRVTGAGMNVWSRLCRSAGLLVAVGSLVVALGASAVVAAPAQSAASNNCAAVTSWAVTVNSTYFFLDQGGSWISSSTEDASGQFGTVSLSVTATSFHAVNPYLPRYNGYTATFNGTVSGNCLVRGTWTSVKGANHGVFTAYPLNLAPAKLDISGNVTGSDGKPLAGIDIDVRNASGVVVASATTNGDGHYQTIELDPATYLVEPATDRADFSPHALRVSLVSSSAVVDFQEGCLSDTPTSDLDSAGRLGAAFITPEAFVPPDCHQLKIDVKLLENLRSGLAVHSIRYTQYPVDFTAVHGSPARFACESGCVDITVTVADPPRGPTGENATVDASVGELRPGVQDWDGHILTPPVYGDGYLCEATLTGADGQCGTSLSIKTDTHGQVHFRYWAPGVVADADTTLTVIASCLAHTACKGAPKTVNKTLTVKPYEIFEHNANLPDAAVLALDEWAGGSFGFTNFLESSTLGFSTLKNALQIVEEAERAAKAAKLALQAAEQIEPISHIIDVGLVINDIFETQGMFALFLQDSGLTTPIGLGDHPFEASVTGLPTTVLTDELTNQVLLAKALSGAFSSLEVGHAGFWWASAQDIHRIVGQTRVRLGGLAPAGKPARYGANVTPTTINLPSPSSLLDFSLHVSVYEVSRCDNQQGTCGPGYGNEPGSDVVNNAGIQPQLVFELSLSHAGVAVEQLGFVIQYDALAWTNTQDHLMAVIRDNS